MKYRKTYNTIENEIQIDAVETKTDKATMSGFRLTKKTKSYILEEVTESSKHNNVSVMSLANYLLMTVSAGAAVITFVDYLS